MTPVLDQATTAGGTLIAFPGRPSTSPVAVESLTLNELAVVFHAATHLIGDHHSRDILRMTDAVTTTIGIIGIDLIRQAAAIVDHAEITLNYELRSTILGSLYHGDHCQTLARVYLAAITPKPSAWAVATTTAAWHNAINTQAVAA
ncbi:hypothetical protein F4553_004468 [Allocatelliglobosispora scoriae]|uniref:Uncharacterized protein n=1 Tax=Allocatelliglobosispora scoriae TaxID=643052 RepID=A0A841BVA2_9ACTN|nr:hypothetical protein [Allocatelliglobosispora scoriae]MBB5871089.1 hypothetical protein [Allocatelliglobosispora scoriae]